MDKKDRKYIPSLEVDWLTPYYDMLIKLIMREKRIKLDLITQANISDSFKILDIGCGTATLIVLIKQLYSGARVISLDPDPIALKIAKKKAAKAKVDIEFIEGMSFELPFAANYFDRVFSSLMLHHLTTENKIKTLNEVNRVLKGGGELHVLDFGRPKNRLMYLMSLIVHRFEDIADNIKGLLPDMMKSCGFIDVKETAKYMTLVGSFSSYQATKKA